MGYVLGVGFFWGGGGGKDCGGCLGVDQTRFAGNWVGSTVRCFRGEGLGPSRAEIGNTIRMLPSSGWKHGFFFFFFGFFLPFLVLVAR